MTSIPSGKFPKSSDWVLITEAGEPSDGVAGLALVEREKGALWRKGFRLHGRSKKVLDRLSGARETSYVEGNPQCGG